MSADERLYPSYLLVTSLVLARVSSAHAKRALALDVDARSSWVLHRDELPKLRAIVGDEHLTNGDVISIDPVRHRFAKLQDLRMVCGWDMGGLLIETMFVVGDDIVSAVTQLRDREDVQVITLHTTTNAHRSDRESILTLSASLVDDGDDADDHMDDDEDGDFPLAQHLDDVHVIAWDGIGQTLFASRAYRGACALKALNEQLETRPPLCTFCGGIEKSAMPTDEQVQKGNAFLQAYADYYAQAECTCTA